MLRGRGSSSRMSHPRMSCSAWAGWGAPNRAGLPHSTLAQTQRQEQTGSTPGPVCAPSKRRGGRPPALVLQKRTAQRSSGLAREALKVPPTGSHCASPDPLQAHPCTGSPGGESEKRARWGQEGFRISLCSSQASTCPSPSLLHVQGCQQIVGQSGSIWEQRLTSRAGAANFKLR